MANPIEATRILTASKNQVETLRAKLQDIDWGISAGHFPREAVDDLKVAVDELRSRVWAIMTAYSGPDGPGALERFRLRRATETLGLLTGELRSGRSRAHDRELSQLGDRAQDLLAEIRAATGGPGRTAQR